MDHPFYSLLAAGHSGAGAVSCILDTFTPVQDTWYCGGWGFWFTKGNYHAAGQNAAAVAANKFESFGFLHLLLMLSLCADFSLSELRYP